MNLYHGTIYKFKQFDIGFAEEYKDFGLGMYLATQLGHAKSIVQNRISNYKVIKIFEVDYNELCRLFNVKRFRGTSIEWVKYIIKNRCEGSTLDYDIVIGPTADAQAHKIVHEFMISHRNRKIEDYEYAELIERLKPNVYPTQYCVKNIYAVRYIESKLVKERVFR